SVLLIASALMVITSRNSVKAVMFLILTFFYGACIWMIMEAEFLAILLILVYVGAVMVLFLFVVMMLDIDFAELKQGFTRHLPIGIIIAGALLYFLFSQVGSTAFGPEAFPIPEPRAADFSSVSQLGMLLYTEYFYAFEIAALILMVAMVAAISLAFRGKREGTKTQKPGEQVKVKKADRVRLVKMAAEVKSSDGADQ
ncbi:MAG: NADH-quinone oxidoreductase subunit J, partial [Gammaproteobacteria bacterium]|nr:NADH-quinone oxidoreductase subunit J [Gammaproteobacteria bacterium]